MAVSSMNDQTTNKCKHGQETRQQVQSEKDKNLNESSISFNKIRVLTNYSASSFIMPSKSSHMRKKKVIDIETTKARKPN